MPATVCAPSLCRVSAPLGSGGVWHSGCIQVKATFIRSALRVFSVLHHPPSIYRHLLQQKSCLKHRKPPFCHVRGRAGQRAHQWRPLSASVCSLNRKISRKVLKVETLDGKGIYGAPRSWYKQFEVVDVCPGYWSAVQFWPRWAQFYTLIIVDGRREVFVAAACRKGAHKSVYFFISVNAGPVFTWRMMERLVWTLTSAPPPYRAASDASTPSGPTSACVWMAMKPWNATPTRARLCPVSPTLAFTLRSTTSKSTFSL